MNTELITQDAQALNNPLEGNMLLSITFKKLGNTRKLKADQLGVDAEERMLTATKKLLDCDEYKAINRSQNQLSQFLRRKSIPGQLFRDSLYLLPPQNIIKCWQEIRRYKDDILPRLVADLVNIYPYRVQQAQEALRSLFNPTQYLPVDDIAKTFQVQYKFFTILTPSPNTTTIAQINAQFFQEARSNAQQEWSTFLTEAKDALRASLRDMVAAMEDALTPSPDGKRKRFYATTLTNLKEFMDDFAARNISNDNELATLVDKCRSYLKGASVDYIRKGPSFWRDEIREGLSNIKDTLSTMVELAPTRAISLDEDPNT